jgi:hypothetical protein
MEDAPQFVPEFDIESSLVGNGSSPDQYVPRALLTDTSNSTHCRYTGAFFPKAKHFVVAGGKFKSVTNIHQVIPSAPPGQ